MDFWKRQTGYEICIWEKSIKYMIKKIIRKFIDEHFLIPMAFKKTSKLKIMSSMDSIRYIIDHKCSLSRFGDGELDSIEGKGGEYQHPSPRLSKMLLECLQSDLPNHKVAIPNHLNHYDGKPKQGFWTNYVVGHHKKFLHWLSFDKVYLDTQLTRFYYEHKDKSHCAEHIGLIKKIWEGRDVVIVEGAKTRSGIGNDLYANAKSIRRILGPALSGFSKYDDIYDFIINNVGKDKLILLSFGITATVLAYELAKLGYQAIDLGHLDIEYEWFRMGAKDRVPIKGKFTYESEDGHNPSQCTDPRYAEQIIADFS